MRNLTLTAGILCLALVAGCGEVKPPGMVALPMPPTLTPRRPLVDFDGTLQAAKPFKGKLAEGADLSDQTAPGVTQNPADATKQMAGTEIQLYGATIDGSEFDWEKYRGKVVLVTFWASWSATSQKVLPSLKDLYQNYRDRGFEIVGVNLDAEERGAKTFIEQTNLPWENIFDTVNQGRIFFRYNPSRLMPAFIMVDRDGRIVAGDVRQPSFLPTFERLLREGEQTGSANQARSGDKVESRPVASAEDEQTGDAFNETASKPKTAAKSSAKSKSKQTKPAATGGDDEGLVEAKVGAGKKGRYGGGYLTEVVSAKFRTEQRLVFDIEIPRALQIYAATNDNKLPATHAAFMKEIIEANSISLPELPDGEEYVWSPEKGKLMVGKKK